MAMKPWLRKVGQWLHKLVEPSDRHLTTAAHLKKMFPPQNDVQHSAVVVRK